VGLATSASYVLNAVSSSKALSASYSDTASFANSFNVAGNLTASNAVLSGTLTAQTLVVQTITSSIDFVTGSTRFGSLLTNTHTFTGSMYITGSITSTENLVISKNGNSTVGQGGFISLQTNSGTNYQQNIQLGNTGSLDFWTYNNSAWTRPMSLNTSGSLFIGNNKIGASDDGVLVGAAFGKNSLSNLSSGSNSTGVTIGTFGNAYGFIDISTQAAVGGWIDFSSGSGEDFQGRIRYWNSDQAMYFYTSGSGIIPLTLKALNGGVGIGNTQPNCRLDILGTTASVDTVYIKTSDFVPASAGSRIGLGFVATTGNTPAVLTSTATGQNTWNDFQYKASNHIFYASNTEVARINSSGNLTFSTSDAGIVFNKSGGLTNSKLNDYEEGTWTPGVAFGGASTGITYGYTNGSYVKIGKVVYITARVSIATKGSSTGNMTVTGIPFQPAGGISPQTNAIQVGGWWWSNFPDQGANYKYIVTRSDQSSNYVEPKGIGATGEVGITNSYFADATAFSFSIMYTTA
jgi:hypothetical protein